MAYTALELTRYGFLGEGSSETPDVKPLPWDLDRPPADPTPAEVRSRRWEAASTVIGVLGGLLGIVLSYRALRSGRGE